MSFLKENFSKPQNNIENNILLEVTLQNYNLNEQELTKYLFKIYDNSCSRYGEEYVHKKDFDTQNLRVIPLGSSFSFQDYEGIEDRITIVLDDDNTIIKAYRG